MLAHPKPARRGPKPPTRLRRTALPPRSGRIARKVRPRPVGKSDGAKLRAIAASLCSKITLAAHEGICIRCGGTATDAMHIYGKKAHPRVRFILLNLLPGCRECHEWLGDCKLAKPSRMLRFVLSLPDGRERIDEIKTAMSYPAASLRGVVAELRGIAARAGIAA